MSAKAESSTLPPWMLEDKLPEECRNILSNLPREKGWGEPYLYLFEGFWYPIFLFENLPTFQECFQAHDTDIILACNPKCGSTWLKSLAFAISNRDRYPPTDNHHPLQTKNSHRLEPTLERSYDFNKQQPDPDPSSPPRILSTHVPYVSLPKSVKESGWKLIYICRDPKDAFISLWHFTNKLRTPEMGTLSLEEALDKFCRGVSLVGPFWDHVLQYWQESLKNPRKVLFLTYEELSAEPVFHVKRIAEFMGCPFSEEEETSGTVREIVDLCSFKSSSNTEVNKNGIDNSGMEYNILFRRGVVEDWKNYLIPGMADRIDRLFEEKFRGSRLKL